MERAGRLLAGEAVDAMQDAGGPVDAEAALARPHTEPELAADVVEVGGAALADALLEPAAADHLALADQLLLLELRLALADPRTEAVVLAVVVSGRTLGRGRARPLVAELAAHRVDEVLRHQPQSRELAARHRQ